MRLGMWHEEGLPFSGSEKYKLQATLLSQFNSRGDCAFHESMCGCGITGPSILKLDTRWREAVSFTPRLLFT
jgi:hypothetical protein